MDGQKKDLEKKFGTDYSDIMPEGLYGPISLDPATKPAMMNEYRDLLESMMKRTDVSKQDIEKLKQYYNMFGALDYDGSMPFNPYSSIYQRYGLEESPLPPPPPPPSGSLGGIPFGEGVVPPNFTLPGGIPVPRTPVPSSGELPSEIFTESSPEAPEISPTVSDAPGATIMEGPQATTFPELPKFDPSSLPTMQEMLSMDTPGIGKIVDPAMPKVLPRIPNIPMPRPNMPSAPLGIQRPPKLGFGKMRQ